ncbi:MAG: hypothetical protein AB7F98_16335 [Novosphingobium sp.]
MSEEAYPAWPPGLWRRIVLQPGPGADGAWIGGALEDDMHRFHLRFDHKDGVITQVKAAALRHPWSECPGAAPHIAGELTGQLLSEVANRDPFQHCTHLFDLAVLMAAHAHDTAPTRFDMRVADRVEGRTTATLERNGEELVRWLLDDTALSGAEPWHGRDLRQLSRWKRELDPELAELATLLRRAIFVSGARQFVPPPDEEMAEWQTFRQGVCFNYQPPQIERTVRSPGWHQDFSESGLEPLMHFDSAQAFAE